MKSKFKGLLSVEIQPKIPDFQELNSTPLVLQYLPYTKMCLKQPLTNRQNKGLEDKWSLMKVESIAECSKRAFCNTFDLH